MDIVKLRDVANVIAGQSPKGEFLNKDEKGTPFYQGKKDYGKKFLRPPTVWTKVVTKTANKGDLLISVRAPVGALNFANQAICIGRGLAAIQVSNKIDKNYLYYVLSDISNNLNVNIGAIFNSISKKQIEDIKFILPSLKEQKNIVDKLDNTLDKTDIAIQKCNLKLKELKFLKRTIIEYLYFNNKSIPSVAISEIAEIKGGKRLPKGKIFSKEKTNFPYLRVSDFDELGGINEENIRYISNDVQKEISQYTISSDDVYISIAGTIGKTGVIPHSLNNANLTENAAKIVLKEECNRDYFYYFTKSFSFKKQAISQTRIAAQPKLALKRLGSVKLPLHNFSQQKEIALKAKKLSENIFKLEDIYLDKLSKLNLLKKAIISKEFRSDSV